MWVAVVDILELWSADVVFTNSVDITYVIQVLFQCLAKKVVIFKHNLDILDRHILMQLRVLIVAFEQVPAFLVEFFSHFGELPHWELHVYQANDSLFIKIIIFIIGKCELIVLAVILVQVIHAKT